MLLPGTRASGSASQRSRDSSVQVMWAFLEGIGVSELGDRAGGVSIDSGEAGAFEVSIEGVTADAASLIDGFALIGIG